MGHSQVNAVIGRLCSMQSNFLSRFFSSDTSLAAEFQQVIRQQKARPLGSGRQSLGTWLKQAGLALVDFLTGTQSLSIRSKALPNGCIQWIVYDPATDTRGVFTSEQAVRVWLEQRYTR